MESLFGVAAYVAVILLIMVIATKLYRRLRMKHYEVPVRDFTKGHRWYMVDIFESPTFCSIGKDAIIHGAQCDSCGTCVADHNMKIANKKIPCKRLSIKGEVLNHHWTQGNLVPSSRCFVCSQECGVEEGLVDYQCCWCKRAVHEDCRSGTFTDVCDLGAYRHAIIPPNCLTLKWVGLKGRRHLIVKSVLSPTLKEWSPVIVIANRKSGNNDGEILLRGFRALLNPAQVFDLHDIKPESAIEWCHLLPDVTCRILVCGGDGTVGWVLNAIDNLQLKTPPHLCILPLGTGNDLSQVLGWGDGYTGDKDLTEILDSMATAQVSKLDRWQVTISHAKHFAGIHRRNKKVKMNNYASIGVDALVTLNFHKRRESWPSLFTHRIINKFCYFTYGTKDVLERECKDLHKKLKVEVDGQELELPELEGVVILNISSWGGGCRPWTTGTGDQFHPPRCDDGLLEVMGLYSSFHIAQLQVGLAAPLKLAQGRSVKISLSGNAPMQVDGEPWEQHPAEILITHHGQATMLASSGM